MLSDGDRSGDAQSAALPAPGGDRPEAEGVWQPRAPASGGGDREDRGDVWRPRSSSGRDGVKAPSAQSAARDWPAGSAGESSSGCRASGSRVTWECSEESASESVHV